MARTIAGEGREEFGPFSEKYVDSLNTTNESDGSILTEMLRLVLLLVDVVLIISGCAELRSRAAEVLFKRLLCKMISQSNLVRLKKITLG